MYGPPHLAFGAHRSRPHKRLLPLEEVLRTPTTLRKSYGMMNATYGDVLAIIIQYLVLHQMTYTALIWDRKASLVVFLP